MPMQKRAECTRQRLIQAAAELIDGGADALGGVDPLPGMELISRTAGVSKGALYYHFRSKEELLEAVGAEAREVLSTLVARHSRADAAEAGLRAVIGLGAAVARRLDHDPVCRAGIRLSCAALRLPPGEAYADWMEPVEALLAAAAEQGELRAGVHPREAASSLLVLALGGLALCESNPGRSRADTVSQLWTMVLPMLAAPELADALGRNTEFI
ncbi:TetR/AcrR family transcriptional regulator [Streptacidiphilus sp. P02-A3a]|uniref:TetR/AcrR family transcriptional regulator n=1 Tax=Streptacidiphilus sp. P02-A3a TaxID=2704468 RepID=UPI0015F84D17|nr:TetR/AcrR family transcriptional regulator [Streptacidiphilus sp. P02-A3a]QMU67026.1 TetR/AcrR family transcriptional regulator [Streptacidiphilus sp. P02-A3a]